MSEGPFDKVIARMRVLRRAPSEEALRRAWQDVVADLHTTGAELEEYAEELLYMDECPTPRDFADWLRTKRGGRSGTFGPSTHSAAYDQNGCLWVVPSGMVDGVRFVPEDEWRRRRPWGGPGRLNRSAGAEALLRALTRRRAMPTEDPFEDPFA